MEAQLGPGVFFNEDGTGHYAYEQFDPSDHYLVVSFRYEFENGEGALLGHDRELRLLNSVDGQRALLIGQSLFLRIYPLPADMDLKVP